MRIILEKHGISCVQQTNEERKKNKPKWEVTKLNLKSTINLRFMNITKPSHKRKIITLFYRVNF